MSNRFQTNEINRKTRPDEPIREIVSKRDDSSNNSDDEFVWESISELDSKKGIDNHRVKELQPLRLNNSAKLESEFDFLKQTIYEQLFKPNDKKPIRLTPLKERIEWNKEREILTNFNNEDENKNKILKTPRFDSKTQFEKLNPKTASIKNFNLNKQIDLDFSPFQKMHRPYFSTVKNEIKEQAHYELPLDDDDLEKYDWENGFDDIKKQLSINELKNEFNVTLSKLDETSDEYCVVKKLFEKTLPQRRILRIEKIDNEWHLKIYEKNFKLIEHKATCVNEMLLFHGTTKINPRDIYTDEIGLDMRYSNDGLWGKAIYFAQNASYSCNYAFKNEDGTLSFFLAKVAVGDYIELAPEKLKLPPLKMSLSESEVKKRYDSVKGKTNGSDVYMIYDNGRVYLKYLITFQ